MIKVKVKTSKRNDVSAQLKKLHNRVFEITCDECGRKFETKPGNVKCPRCGRQYIISTTD